MALIAELMRRAFKKRRGKLAGTESPTDGIGCPHGLLQPERTGPRAKRAAMPPGMIPSVKLSVGHVLMLCKHGRAGHCAAVHPVAPGQPGKHNSRRCCSCLQCSPCLRASRGPDSNYVCA